MKAPSEVKKRHITTLNAFGLSVSIPFDHNILVPTVGLVETLPNA